LSEIRRSAAATLAGANSEIHKLSAATLAGGERRPEAVVDALLDRIEERNDRTNAFVTITDERAREAAREADRMVEEGIHLAPCMGSQ